MQPLVVVKHFDVLEEFTLCMIEVGQVDVIQPLFGLQGFEE